MSGFLRWAVRIFEQTHPQAVLNLLHVFKETAEMWLISSVFSIFALCSPERHCTVCTSSHSIAPWQLALLSELTG